MEGLLLAAVPDELPLTRRERALLCYAETLTLAPASITAASIEPLRAEGLDDRAIHDACAIVAYFAFVNRIADGLGVELEHAGAAQLDGTEQTSDSEQSERTRPFDGTA